MSAVDCRSFIAYSRTNKLEGVLLAVELNLLLVPTGRYNVGVFTSFCLYFQTRLVESESSDKMLILPSSITGRVYLRQLAIRYNLAASPPPADPGCHQNAVRLFSDLWITLSRPRRSFPISTSSYYCIPTTRKHAHTCPHTDHHTDTSTSQHGWDALDCAFNNSDSRL